MRIACLQFAPQVGDVDNNLNRADSVLSRANPKNIDLLVLPELAFSGYNFRSLQHISPYLEPTTSGITSLWARTTALKHNCHVIVGYPEKVDVSPKWPASPEYYNSAITVNPDGETIANYRKSFLYYTDETWALEGPDGFYDGVIEGLGNVAMGICKWPTKSFERMDLNPYKFEAPWSAWEFAYHILHRQANLVVLSMAWLTREDARSYSREPKEPDMETLSYWLSRLEPLIRAEGEDEIICVLANRCGVEEEAVYAGTSAVLGIQSGEVKVYGILGRGEKELLVVDTSKRAQMQLISEPKAPTTKTPSSKPGSKSPTTGSGKPSDSSSPKPGASKPSGSTSPKSGASKPSSPMSPKPWDAKSAPSSSSTKAPASTSSTTSPVDSTRSVTSALSVETGPSSLDPSIEVCTFSPVSPVDHPFKQAFFGPPSPMPRPASRAVKEREPTPVPKTFEPVPAVTDDRYSTPAPHSRPASPKSRNASRSRGPTLIDSPPIGENEPNEIRFSRSHFSNYWAESPLVEEFPPSSSSSPKYPHVSESSITQTVTLDFSNLNLDDPKVQIEILGQTDVEMDAEEKKATRTSRAGSENSSQYESSFTRNTLGPRSQHMSPRPRSTQW